MVWSEEPEYKIPSWCARLHTGPWCPCSVNFCFKMLLFKFSALTGSAGLLLMEAINIRSSFIARSKLLFLYSIFASICSMRFVIVFNVLRNISPICATLVMADVSISSAASKIMVVNKYAWKLEFFKTRSGTCCFVTDLIWVGTY